jgi:hypothetical protein
MPRKLAKTMGIFVDIDRPYQKPEGHIFDPPVFDMVYLYPQIFPWF